MNFLKALTFFTFCPPCSWQALYSLCARNDCSKSWSPLWKAAPLMISGQRRLGLLMAGLGLIVLGGASAWFLSNSRPDETLQPTDFSAVPVAVNYPAPALVLQDLGGARHALSDYAGQVLLINLWATWCPPCQAEMPLLQQYFERHRDSEFAVIAIEDGDPIAEVQAFVSSYRLTFPIWLDPDHQATDHAFKTISLPSSYVIDRTSRVRLVWLGAISEANLEKYVTPVIQER